MRSSALQSCRPEHSRHPFRIAHICSVSKQRLYHQPQDPCPRWLCLAAIDQTEPVSSTSGRHINEPILNSDLCVEIDLRIKGATALPLLLQLVRNEHNDFTYVNTTHALYRLSKLYQMYNDRLHASTAQATRHAHTEFVQPTLVVLNQKVVQQLGSFDAWGVAITIWAYGSCGVSDPNLLQRVCTRAVEFSAMDMFNPSDCACVMVGLSRMNYRCVKLLDQLTPAIVGQLEEFTPRELANCAHSWAKLKYNPGSFALEALCDVMLWKVGTVNTQEAANTLWALASLGHYHRPILVTLSTYFLQNLEHSNPADIANILYAFKELHFKPTHFLDAAAYHVIKRISEYTPREICAVLTCYGHFRHVHPPLLAAVEKAAKNELQHWRPKELMQVLWAYGALGYRFQSQQFLELATNRLQQSLGELTPQAIAMTFLSFGKLGWRPQPFLDKLAQEAINNVDKLRPRELVNLLDGCFCTGTRPDVFNAVFRQTHHLLCGNPASIGLGWREFNCLARAFTRAGYDPQHLVLLAEVKQISVSDTFIHGRTKNWGRKVGGTAAKTSTAERPGSGEVSQQQDEPQGSIQVQDSGGAEEPQAKPANCGQRHFEQHSQSSDGTTHLALSRSTRGSGKSGGKRALQILGLKPLRHKDHHANGRVLTLPPAAQDVACASD